jgi:hypothetical protein
MADLESVEIEKRFERLSFDAKLRVLERLVRHLRRGTVDSCEFERSVSEMASDPALLRELGVESASQDRP